MLWRGITIELFIIIFRPIYIYYVIFCTFACSWQGEGRLLSRAFITVFTQYISICSQFIQLTEVSFLFWINVNTLWFRTEAKQKTKSPNTHNQNTTEVSRRVNRRTYQFHVNDLCRLLFQILASIILVCYIQNRPSLKCIHQTI